LLDIVKVHEGITKANASHWGIARRFISTDLERPHPAGQIEAMRAKSDSALRNLASDAMNVLRLGVTVSDIFFDHDERPRGFGTASDSGALGCRLRYAPYGN
jgi:hypothetical protein